jgi:hypothetical protein
LEAELVLSDHESDRFRQLDSVLSEATTGKALFVVTYGPLVLKQIRYLRKATSNPILYYAQSFGWPQLRGMLPNSYSIPPEVPIVCNSRYVLAQWNLHAPGNKTAYIPPPISPCFRFVEGDRDIDVLLQVRKMSKYCLKQLVPSLLSEGLNVLQIENWITQPELASLLNRTKVFLYVGNFFQRRKWNQYPMGEGLGLPPLEALACGCIVGSNLLGGVNDFLTPEKNAIKVLLNDPKKDAKNIVNAVQGYRSNALSSQSIASQYSEKRIAAEWHDLLLRWYPHDCASSAGSRHE